VAVSLIWAGTSRARYLASQAALILAGLTPSWAAGVRGPRQIDLICAPQVMSAERPLATPNGGSGTVQPANRCGRFKYRTSHQVSDGSA
jgi:hypothetical protein